MLSTQQVILNYPEFEVAVFYSIHIDCDVYLVCVDGS